MARELARTGASFELHYSTRTPDAPFADELAGLGGAAKFHHHTGGRKQPGGLSVEQVLSGVPPGTVVYCCGPQGYRDVVRAATASWPEEDVRFEAFQAPQEDGFIPALATVQIKSTGETLHVAADESVLEVLNRKGFDIPSKCSNGVCGTCEIGYLSGKVLHRDAVLGPKAHQRRIMPCVSRTNTTVLLDL
jgi:vanillate O-demethylase ferredoxin subunit